ncbi:hypothetical protein N431DRAFT_435260 [Stipitochalara longipes BDJ]|nr:hypothetical protein N431DRAFT_435260 [Stipitochalara longipes BDJ]
MLARQDLYDIAGAKILGKGYAFHCNGFRSKAYDLVFVRSEHLESGPFGLNFCGLKMQQHKTREEKKYAHPLSDNLGWPKGLRFKGDAATRRRRKATRTKEKTDAHPLSDDLGLLKEDVVKSKARSGWMLRTWVDVVRDCVYERKFVVGDARGSQ